jgi:hypothetical protein
MVLLRSISLSASTVSKSLSVADCPFLERRIFLYEQGDRHGDGDGGLCAHGESEKEEDEDDDEQGSPED